ncbi:General transcription factor II-I repeat domain-containing protein 2B [Thelohanellus kitauei]|uniref:General transcription factor II-I repeat domain-containing protein 2B n=1 Tax=Thelohanellus kitauei TaxID=669202 RepID=A0A0C2J7X3_THEKT|nr:General transcription factor II-I repeat domain-containing protein 2B [Thelohanellus kitauei]
MELIEIPCDSILKDKFVSVDIGKFYTFASQKYPMLAAFSARIFSMFGTSYVCERLFSIMNLNKSKYRSKLTYSHLNAVPRVSTAQTLAPGFDELVSAKRC